MATVMGWKIGGEVKQFLLVTLYMYACFIALLLYSASIAGVPVGLTNVGTALLKAMLLAKFVLLGHWLHLGDRNRGWRGIYSVLYQALAMWVFMLLLSVIERVIETRVRGESIASALAAFHGHALVTAFAHGLILFLVLLPYVAFRQVGAVLGPGELNRIFFRPRA